MTWADARQIVLELPVTCFSRAGILTVCGRRRIEEEKRAGLMNPTRTEALTALLDEIAAIEIKVDDYYSDLEPQGYYDNFLTGLVNSLLAFCQTLGWSELIAHLRDMVPFRGNAVISLETLQRFIVPEARRLLAASDIEVPPSPNQWFWEFVHPRICALARPRFEAGFFGDAVEASFKELNDAVKRVVRDTDGRELDGASLMNTAFSPNNPIIRLTPLATPTERTNNRATCRLWRDR